MRTLISLKLCNDHLIHLYQALQRNDVSKVYEIEHYLTHTEECVACSYVLHTQGSARDVLENFLEQQGIEILPKKLTFFAELKFWLGRIILFGVVFYLLYQGGLVLKRFFFESPNISNLGIFGFLGVFVISLSFYMFIEYRVID